MMKKEFCLSDEDFRIKQKEGNEEKIPLYVYGGGSSATLGLFIYLI